MRTGLPAGHTEKVNLRESRAGGIAKIGRKCETDTIPEDFMQTPGSIQVSLRVEVVILSYVKGEAHTLDDCHTG
jgi:hypothetical protein